VLATRSRQTLRTRSSRSVAPTIFACRSTPKGVSPGSLSLPSPARRARSTTDPGALRALPRDTLRAALTASVPLLGGRADVPGAPWRGPDGHLSGLPAAVDIVTDGRQGDREQARDLLPELALVYRCEHPQSQVLRAGAHRGSIARYSFVLQTAVASNMRKLSTTYEESARRKEAS
jgi:hypothetical protein